jgi:ankyrin repeat protein
LQFLIELIKAGADLGMSNDFGEFPLYAAIHHSRINVFFEIIKRFKSNINCLSTGFTPLNLASAKNLPEITKALLENGADPNLLDKFGKTALKVAEAKNYTAVIKVLNKYKKNKCQFITHNWGSNHLISGN